MDEGKSDGRPQLIDLSGVVLEVRLPALAAGQIAAALGALERMTANVDAMPIAMSHLRRTFDQAVAEAVDRYAATVPDEPA